MTRIALAPSLDHLDREAIEKIQQRNFKLTLSAIRQRSGTKAIWNGLEHVHTADDLPELAPFTPSALHASCPPATTDLIVGDSNEGIVLRTSGTSGRPKVLFHSWDYYRRAAFLGGRGLLSELRRRPQGIVNCMHAGELTGAFMTVLEAAREVDSLCFPLGDDISVAELSKLISRYGADTLVASPSMLAEFVAHVGTSGTNVNLSTLMFLGASPDSKLATDIEDVLPGVRLCSFAYATSENGPIGYGCPELGPESHHIHDDAFVVEVANADGTPVSDGEVGDVLITSLSDTGMPLLRYRIGDRGFITRGGCACGSFASCLTLTGRADESISIGVTTISRDLILELLTRHGDFVSTDFQLKIERRSDGYDLCLAVSDGAPELPSVETLIGELRSQAHLNRVLTNRSFGELRIERIPTDQFQRNRRGKTPFFVELSVEEPTQQRRSEGRQD